MRDYELKVGASRPINRPGSKEKAIDVEFTPPTIHEKNQEKLNQILITKELPALESFPPMEVGNIVNIEYNIDSKIVRCDVGSFGDYEVVAKKKGVIMLCDLLDCHYLLDPVKLTLTELLDKDRCTDCGQFICKCNSETKEKTIIIQKEIMSNPIGIKDIVENYSDKQNIPCVEGVLTTVYEAKPGTKGKFKWHNQGAILVDRNDQTEVRVNFNDASVAQVATDQPDSLKNKVVRITPPASKPSALHWKFGKDGYDPEIVVGSGCTIVVIGGAAPPKSSGGQKSNNRQSTESETTTAQPHYQITTFKERADSFFKALAEVTPKCAELTLSEDSTIKIAMYLCGTYRADKGAYAPPVFSMEDLKPKKFDWRSVKHIKKNKTFGEFTPAEMLAISKWALNTPEQTDEYVESCRKAGIGIAEEMPKEMTLLELHGIEGFSEDHLKFFLETKGMELEKISIDQWFEILKDIKTLVDDFRSYLIEQSEKNQTASVPD